MRLVTAGLIALLISAPVAAQQAPPTAQQRAALLHSGNIKFWTGIGFLGAGALLTPLTATKPGRSVDRSAVARDVGVAMIFTGGTLAWLGARDRHKAVSPETTFRVTIGTTSGLQIRRAWP
jgi:hypothetical protein